jgi:hypothetical protein
MGHLMLRVGVQSRPHYSHVHNTLTDDVYSLEMAQWIGFIFAIWREMDHQCQRAALGLFEPPAEGSLGLVADN